MTVAALLCLALPMCLRCLNPVSTLASTDNTSWHSSLAGLPRILTTQIQDVLTQICTSTELVMGEAKQRKTKNTAMLQVSDQAKLCRDKIRTIFL